MWAIKGTMLCILKVHDTVLICKALAALVITLIKLGNKPQAFNKSWETTENNSNLFWVNYVMK